MHLVPGGRSTSETRWPTGSMGDKLGLYQAMAEAGPLTPDQLAGRTGTAERYVREWLNAQAAGDFVNYEPETGRYFLPPEQATALTDASSPAYLPGFFQLALGSVVDSPRITEAARSGAGFGWHEHGTDVLCVPGALRSMLWLERLTWISRYEGARYPQPRPREGGGCAEGDASWVPVAAHGQGHRARGLTGGAGPL